MPVKNIECQIARGQIGRYLAGESLSDEALKQLEGHIVGCPECKGALMQRRESLQAMLDEPAPEPAP